MLHVKDRIMFFRAAMISKGRWNHPCSVVILVIARLCSLDFIFRIGLICHYNRGRIHSQIIIWITRIRVVPRPVCILPRNKSFSKKVVSI